MLLRMSDSEPLRAGFLLAGGMSTRMGTDKAFLIFDGQTLLDRALIVMQTVCKRMMIVGDPAKFANYDAGAVIADIFPGCGPLAGIHSALVHSVAELNLVLAVDMPFVTAELLLFLFAVAEKNAAVVTVPRVTVPRANDGLQPLCAVYRRDFAAAAERALRAGNYKIDALFSSVSTDVIETAKLAAAGFSARNFFNVNTPQDRVDGERDKV
jgi:molybdopterin-guanine dinucleotide biosynthesis protein A